MTREPVQFMSHHTKVEYKLPAPSLLSIESAKQLAAGRVVGHKCPECGKVYVPARGYCPLCVIETTAAHEVEVQPRGIVTTFSVITPLQYQGQEEHDDYAQATILLAGTDSTISMQRLDGIPIDDVRTGMRVEAVWLPESERSASPEGAARGFGLGRAITGWKLTGEPDAPVEEYGEHIL
ncbi:MAG: OB-fold domain-containing protein [Actinomycetota bacterium]|nr:OB-fold domain-containing protein [Actinomycetota bacterium]